jgi:DNA-binding response OmpR family regulator
MRPFHLSRLLIIEDDLNTLSGLQELLRDEGFTVRGVTLGRKAYEAVAREPFDMVLCDYCLPDIDGLQICRELKRMYPRLALFLVTAYRNTEVVNAAMQCGVEAIIDKPIILEELFATLAATAARIRNKRRYVPAPIEKPVFV